MKLMVVNATMELRIILQTRCIQNKICSTQFKGLWTESGASVTIRSCCPAGISTSSRTQNCKRSVCVQSSTHRLTPAILLIESTSLSLIINTLSHSRHLYSQSTRPVVAQNNNNGLPTNTDGMKKYKFVPYRREITRTTCRPLEIFANLLMGIYSRGARHPVCF